MSSNLFPAEFASALAKIVRNSEDAVEPTSPDDLYGQSEGGTYDAKKRKPNKPDPADWWKRGEEPPL